MIKLFCNQCQRYIRDAVQKDMSKLVGDEICEDCRDRNKEAFKEVDMIQRQASSAINALADKYKVQLDEAIRKVLK